MTINSTHALIERLHSIRKSVDALAYELAETFPSGSAEALKRAYQIYGLTPDQAGEYADSVRHFVEQIQEDLGNDHKSLGAALHCLEAAQHKAGGNVMLRV